MKTIKQLKAELADVKAEGRGIITAADGAGRELTAEENARFDAIEATIGELEGKIAAAERDAERRRSVMGDAVQVATGRVEVGADRATLDPRAGFASLAEFASAVRRAHPQTPSGSVDARLAGMYQAAPTGYMREGASNDGYMVPPEFRNRIWELVFAGDNLLSEIDSEPTSANQINDLTDEWTPWGTTGIQARWRHEAQQMTPSRPSVTPRSVVLHELFAFVTASDELLEDAPRLNNRLENKAAQAINWKIDDAIIYGDGVGKPLGYMQSSALVTVAKESGQAADTVNATNVTKMFSRLLPDGIRRAQWRINSDVLPALEGLTIGDRPVWIPPNGLADAPGGLLMGRPIKLTEHSKTLGDAGDIQLIDPMGYYGATKQGGIKFASSLHLYFDYGLQAFRWTIRFGGQPHLKAPISPKHGSATKSHFVTLAERA